MKKIIVIFTLAIGLLFTLNSFTKSSNDTYSPDIPPTCKTVGNVTLELHEHNRQVYIYGCNYNEYPVTVSYTIKATNGEKEFTAGSGTLYIKAEANNTSGRVKTVEGYTYYPIFGTPMVCK